MPTSRQSQRSEVEKMRGRQGDGETRRFFSPTLPLPHSPTLLVFCHLFSVFCFLSGCTRAPGPILTIDRARLKEIKSISVEEVVNTTPIHEVTPLVEQSLETELLELKIYKFTEKADARIKCIVTGYTPLKSELVKSGKEVDYSISDFRETKEEAKRGHGCLWGALVDFFIPSHRVKGGEEYKYKTITQSPLIGIELTLIKDGDVIYKGSKFMSEESRIPDCYSATYGSVLPRERINSIDFVVNLAIKELLEPLK